MEGHILCIATGNMYQVSAGEVTRHDFNTNSDGGNNVLGYKENGEYVAFEITG